MKCAIAGDYCRVTEKMEEKFAHEEKETHPLNDLIIQQESVLSACELELVGYLQLFCSRRQRRARFRSEVTQASRQHSLIREEWRYICIFFRKTLTNDAFATRY